MGRFDLVALSVLAAAMAVFVVLDDSTAGNALTNGRILPEQRELELIGFERRPSGGVVEVFGNTKGGPMAMLAPVPAPLDPIAVADLEGTLELLSFRRAVDDGQREARGLEPASLELELRYASGRKVVLQVGAYLPETDQYWLARRDGSQLWLIDGYAGRVLLRGGDELRSRRPLPMRHREISAIELSAGDQSLVLSGRPLQVHLEGGGRARLHADARRSIVSRIDKLRLSRFAALPPGAPAPSFLLRILGGDGPRELADYGPCSGASGQRLVDTPVGAGCVAEASLAELALTLDFRERLIDTHLVDPDAGKPVSITIARGELSAALEAVGGGWRLSSGERVDLHAVFEWARDLDQLAQGDPLPVVEKPRVLATSSLGYAGGRVDVIELLAGNRVRRAGESVAYATGDDAAAVFEPTTPRFRDRAVWSRDPSAIRRMAKRRRGSLVAELRRGELLEDWSASAPVGAVVDRQRVGELLETLARLRARGYVAGTLGRVALTVEVDLQDGATRALQITASCRARVSTGDAGHRDGRDDAVFLLTESDCALLLGPWTLGR